MAISPVKPFLAIDKALQFFATLTPKALKFIVLVICIVWKHYISISSRHKYMSMIDEMSSKFVCRSREGQNNIGDSSPCAICLSEICDGEEVRQLKCRHSYHRKCVDQWLTRYDARAATCAVCRGVVLPKETVDEYKSAQSECERFQFEEELALILLSTVHRRSCNEF